MYSKKEVLTYHIVFGWGAKKIHGEMVREGKYPPSRNTIRKLLNKYDAVLLDVSHHIWEHALN